MDRICETTTTTGTGTITLAGAVAGYLRFQDVLSGSSTFYYLIEAVDANGVATGVWETGIGICPTSTTMTRSVVLDDSSSSGTALNLAAGTKRVHLVANAYMLQSKAFSTIRSSNLTAQNFTTATAIAWNSASSNINTMQPYSGTIAAVHDSVTNNSRLTIPTGFENVSCKFLCQVSLQNITASEWVELKIRLDGSTIIGRNTCASPSTTPTYQVASQVFQLGSAQYAEALIQVQTDTSIDILSAGSFFQIEILQ